MIAGATGKATITSRLLARWEVSRLAVMPTSFTMMSGPLGVSGLYVLGKLVGRAGLSVGFAMAAFWSILVVIEHGRAIWRMRHPFASPAWLRSLRAAVGDGLVDQALAHLAAQHASTPGYLIRRYDVAVAIWVQRSARREAKRRTEGLHLEQVLRGS